LKIKFWGVRGSVPTPIPECMGVGGNTSCVQVITPDNDLIILDAGTGLRMLGKNLVKKQEHLNRQIHLLLTHTHWDHIQGLPFFRLLNHPENQITIYGANKPRQSLASILNKQMSFEYFPVSLDEVAAEVLFHPLQEETFSIGNIRIQTAAFNHPGGVYAYRLQLGKQVLVYATDMEYTKENLDPRLIQFCSEADLLIFDAQYTPEELLYKTGWGHSSHLLAAHLAQKAQVKQLFLFSHDPDHHDQDLEIMEAEAQKLFSETHLAREGLSIDLNSIHALK